MKKILVFLVMGLLMLMSSCSIKPSTMNNVNYGKIDYQVVGIYFDYATLDTKSLETIDHNPKFYFNFSGDMIYKVMSGGSYFTVKDSSNVAEDKGSYFLCYMNVLINLATDDEKKVEVYPIYLKDGVLSVDDSLSDSVKVSKGNSYNYQVSYEFNNQKYKTEIRVKFE